MGDWTAPAEAGRRPAGLFVWEAATATILRGLELALDRAARLAGHAAARLGGR